jgi:ribosomal protein S18 acetylase RimI-like enzyme
MRSEIRTTIRTLNIDDHQALLALWRRAGLNSIRPAGRDSHDAFRQQFATGVQTVLGMELDGELIGAVIATHDSRKGWINRLAVAPEHQGCGYGARLVQAAEDLLREQGMRVIAALIHGDNETSLRLFQHLGYTDSGPHIHYVSKRDTAED